MFDRFTRGRMTISIPTQVRGKDGGLREDLPVIVTDRRGGQRDVGSYSKGQKRIIRTVMKLAIGRWRGEMHGVTSDFIALDETFDGLDDENEAEMLDMLLELGALFSAVHVITHDDAIAARLPGQVRVGVAA